MGRPLRNAAGGVVYHVLNWANGRTTIFGDDADYAAFLRIVGEAVERVSMRLLAWCIMPNHWATRPGRSGPPPGWAWS
ncbi:MAG TPA: hypothetical protein PLS82_14605 [Phycisphaerae bacterium]|jgi:putative transposase|nr:hypothetical protein [Phycisphaerae bacterium]